MTARREPRDLSTENYRASDDAKIKLRLKGHLVETLDVYRSRLGQSREAAVLRLVTDGLAHVAGAPSPDESEDYDA